MKSIKLKFLLITIVYTYNSYAQSSLPKNVTDSLWAVWADKSQADTNRLEALFKFAFDGYIFTQPDSAFYYAKLSYEFAKKRNLYVQQAYALNLQGNAMFFLGNYDSSLVLYNRSLNIKMKLGDNQGVSNTLSNIGNVYLRQSKLSESIKFYTKSLNINKKLGNKSKLANDYTNLGGPYLQMGEHEKAKSYYLKSLKILQEIDDKYGLSTCFSNIGALYKEMGDYNKAIEYYTNSFNIDKDLNNIIGMSTSLCNIGVIYAHLNDNQNAIKYYLESLEMSKKANDLDGISNAVVNIASAHLANNDTNNAEKYYNESIDNANKLNNNELLIISYSGLASIMTLKQNYDKAIYFVEKSIALAKKIGHLPHLEKSLIVKGSIYYSKAYYDKYNKVNVNNAINAYNESLLLSKQTGNALNIKLSSDALYRSYKWIGNQRLALENYELYIKMRDSIDNIEAQKSIIKQQSQFKYEKQKAIDDAEYEKNIAIEQGEKEKQKIISYATVCGLVLVVTFLVFVFNRLQITRKQKTIIELKERETQQQKHLIEEKHKEITDSINYAERIQRSFLATRDMLDEHLRDYFVFFKPKDVVSGDFYWAAQLNNGNFAFTVADSTGHGVPGAIMSILNISSLEKSIETENEPNTILNQTRKIIINRLKKDGSPNGGKDGMDCSLLVLNKDKSCLTFASANNPVVIIRQGEIIEFKADKMPVGKHDKDQDSFTLQTVQLQQGDVIYTLTDGFPDQFGGDKGKKFMIKKLKELFAQMAHLPMIEQEQKLSNEFAAWKGENEQVDDVCIIGVRV